MKRASGFALAVSLASLLLTAVLATEIWESYFPDTDAEGLRQRRAYYEKTLLKANVSWTEGSYYRVVEGDGAK